MYAHILAVADEEGSLRLLNINRPASESLLKGNQFTRYFLCYMYIHVHYITVELATHSNAVFDIAWKPGGEQIVSHVYNVQMYVHVIVCDHAYCRVVHVSTLSYSVSPLKAH